MQADSGIGGLGWLVKLSGRPYQISERIGIRFQLSALIFALQDVKSVGNLCTADIFAKNSVMCLNSAPYEKRQSLSLNSGVGYLYTLGQSRIAPDSQNSQKILIVNRL
jgi:hypothetical protein